MTVYPSYIATGELPHCANWVFMFERTLPNQGGRSLVDNELSDSGAVLAHEIGHQMVREHRKGLLAAGLDTVQLDA